MHPALPPSLTLVIAIFALGDPLPDQAGGVDYASIPPSAGEVEKKLSALEVTLAQAVDSAVRDAGGIASSARLAGSEESPVYEVRVYAGGKALEIAVDVHSGAVKSRAEIPRFPGQLPQGEWTEKPSGLKYFDLAVGTGLKPSGAKAQVVIHYTSWLLDGSKFDSSYDRKQPATVALDQVVKGWTEGIGDMRVGGKRKLIVPAGLGFGDKGRQGQGIPANATLVCDVELLEVVQ